jgi:hypothetical protein
VKRHELLDHLRRHGCALSREGSRHSIFFNPAAGAKAPVLGMFESEIKDSGGGDATECGTMTAG